MGFVVLPCDFQPKLMRNRISVFVSALACFASVDAAKRPNVVLIMADDFGFADLGCYGSEIQTPNLDTLAAEELRFSQYGQVPLTSCSPASTRSRCGRQPWPWPNKSRSARAWSRRHFPGHVRDFVQRFALIAFAEASGSTGVGFANCSDIRLGSKYTRPTLLQKYKFDSDGCLPWPSAQRA